MAQDTVIPRKRRGPVPTGQGTPVVVRLQPDDLISLDAIIAAQPDQPSRPEMIRRLIADDLEGVRQIKERVLGATEPAVAEKAAKVRSKAASAADEALKGIEAPAEVKAARRKALTEKPAMVAKAKAKRSPGPKGA